MKNSETTNIPNIIIKQNKALFISDLHFGVRSSSDEWRENIKSYFYDFFIPFIKNLKISNPEDEYVLIVLGDVFDDRKSININDNELAIDIFEEISSIISVIIINGNHDLAKKTNRGNSSLRSLSNINNLTVIRKPTLITVKPDKKIINKFIAIPYLGNYAEENATLRTYSGKAKYAFMHTDISKMKYDNGMQIVGAVDAELFKGTILSGHIHKRQESKNVYYIGCPYQLRRSDIDNQKGIYQLDIENNEIVFFPNNFSPIFHKIKVEELLEMNINDRNKFLRNNYNDIIINENDLRTYKPTDIYDIGNIANAKRMYIAVNKSKKVDIDENIEYSEMSIEDLINDSINNLDVDDTVKDRLLKKSQLYLHNAQNLVD